MIKDLVLKRSCRRFYQDVVIERETLRELVDLARLSASSINRQPLKYFLSCDPARNAVLFSHLSWAGLLRDWPGPPEGERPSAYIIILGDTGISKNVSIDHGIAAQSMMLGAREKGMGGCIHAGIRRNELSQALGIPPRYEILLMLSLCKPKEVAVIDTLEPDGDSRYWRDAEGVHHVPKRRLDDIIIG
ncbi:MAG: nitroreductase family protein [Chloroflexi bacterium]|nr:nitroreductase family protein [Chloroflexota bacterium]